MIELENKELGNVRPLCRGRKDTVLVANLEGNIGRTWVDHKDNSNYAVIVAGDFAYLLGNIEALKEIDIILGSVLEECKGKIIVTDESSWITILSKYYSDTFRRFNRYSFKKDLKVFQLESLKENIIRIDTDFQIIKIDERIYHMVLLDPFMADLCSFFSSLEEFMEHGVGFVIIKNNQIVTGASSYTYHEGSIEVTIGTHAQYRRKGLAQACASRLILECVNRNIYPNWDAANTESVKLAEKLGYQMEREYEVYSI